MQSEAQAYLDRLPVAAAGAPMPILAAIRQYILLPESQIQPHRKKYDLDQGKSPLPQPPGKQVKNEFHYPFAAQDAFQQKVRPTLGESAASDSESNPVPKADVAS
jgi:hypothetical protein